MRRDAMLIPLYLWVSVSLLVHFWGALGTRILAERVGDPTAVAAGGNHGAGPGTSDVDVEFIPPPAPPPAPAAPAVAAVTARPRVPPPHHEPVVRPPTVPRPPTVRPRPVAAVPTPPQPLTPLPQTQYVHQNNPNQEPPPDHPHFLAQASRNVAEETVAQVRNLHQDEPQPQLGGTPRTSTVQAEGNADRSRSADAREVRGDHTAIPHEDPHLRNQPSPPASAVTALRQAAATAGDNVRRAGDSRTVGRTGLAGEASLTMDPVQGEPVNAVAAMAPGQGGQGGQAGQAGQGGAGADHVGIRGMGAARALAALTPTMSTYEAVFGAQEIEHQRVVAAQERSAARGSYTDQWRQTRSAIENYTPDVRVGNQTALRTAASPFAEYLTAMHRRIHRLFADGYLSSLDAVPHDSPLNDDSLVVTLEIVLERSGAIHRLGVVRTSGVLPFDVAAVNSVRRAAPFGDAPEPILSGDGRVYLHWGFYRNNRQCGTFNAEPYILPHPGGGGSPHAPSRLPDESPPRGTAPEPGASVGSRALLQVPDLG